MPFRLQKLSIPDILLLEPDVHHDGRGFFIESYKASELALVGLHEPFVQDCHSKSTRSILRGLHFQRKNPQSKLIRVIQGKIFDVVVDIRFGSPTYGLWTSTNLSEENRYILYIPSGFAHGFCVLSDTAEILYKMTQEYDPKNQDGILWNDPDIGITWPLKNPILSQKDLEFPRLKDVDTGFVY